MTSTSNQEKIIAALLETGNQRDAAQKAGVSVRTVQRYLTQADFITRYNEEKRKILDAANVQIQGALAPSIKALRSIVENKKAPLSTKVMAARAILEYSIRLAEYSELEARIRILESHEITGQAEL